MQVRTSAVLAILILLCVCASSNAQIIRVQGSGRVDNSNSAPRSPSSAHSDSLVNQDVIEMVHLPLPDDIVIQKIQSAPSTNFDLSLAGLKALKSAKISDAVIRVMLNPKSAGLAPTSASLPMDAALTYPKEVGVYHVKDGKFIEMEPEVVGWQTGGVVKAYATLGMDKGHVNGKVMKPNSPLRLANPVEFIVKTMEGTSVTEYQLLKLYKKDNRREFRAFTGGVFHATGGAERTAVPFKSEKIGERTWRIHLESLVPGEYGFLPPGVSSASIAANGKMFTFSIIE